MNDAITLFVPVMLRRTLSSTSARKWHMSTRPGANGQSDLLSEPTSNPKPFQKQHFMMIMGDTAEALLQG